jgi:uroporphyrinogen III methyltransferase/synthase
MRPRDLTDKPLTGKVVFIGAGPGHPDLMTVRGRRWLERAEVVVHDRLVPHELLATVNPKAELVPVPRGHMTDTDRKTDPGTRIGEMLVDLAAGGRTIIRLKGGDPSVFARLAEELQPLRQAGVTIEIVPGVTAALAAAAAAGIPITTRAAASSATLVTGHEADKPQSGIDFNLLANLTGTIAIYMGVDQAAAWSQGLLDAGKPADTPITIVSRCSWPDQRIAVSSLGRCSTDFASHAWPAPAIAIVGEVAHLPPPVPSVAQPLAGRRVLITRPAGQAETMVDLVAEQGGIPIHVPVMRIEPPGSWDELDAAIRAADTFDWIVFSSANGVQSFLARLRALGRDGRSLGTVRLAAVGPATAAALTDAGYMCDLVPASFRAEGLVDEFAGMPPHCRFLLVRAARGRDLLRRELAVAGHDVAEAVAYQSIAVTNLDPVAESMLAEAAIDWVVMTSPALAESAITLFGDRLQGWRIASISPLTSAALRSHGVVPAAEAGEASAAGLVAAMAAWELAHPAQPLHSEPTSPAARS